MTLVVGRLAAAWRYPVSSAGGERVAALSGGPDGLDGDRRWAIVDASSGRTATPERERRWHGITFVAARATPAGPELRLPGGDWLPAETAAAALSGHLGFPVRVAPYGKAVRHRYRPAHAHLLTTASVQALAEAVPGSDLDPARFRPNLLVQTGAEAAGTVEQEWLGRELRVGSLRFAVNTPCGRCSFTSLPQPGLALDRDILRALIRRHARQFGVLLHVLDGGQAAEGDLVTLH